MGILQQYKRWKPQLHINRTRYLDFVLSNNNSVSVNIDGNLTKRCLISFIDMENPKCIGKNGHALSLTDYTYANAINENVVLDDIGFTGVDNGLVPFDKNIDLKEFTEVLTDTTLSITSGDTRLHLMPSHSHTQAYNQSSEYVIGENERYYAMKGGFLQGFYKLFNFDYQVLPQDIITSWNLEFVIRPRNDYQTSGVTINDEHPENKGIFFYMGARAENKFARFYGDDMEKYPKRKGSTKPEEVKNNDILTSEGHSLESNKYFDVETDNKFLIFDRTKNGYTVDTWDDEDILKIVQKKLITDENLFLLMHRAKGGYTVDTIEKYIESAEHKKGTFNSVDDMLNNAFALKCNDDGSIGFKYLIKDCDNEKGYSFAEEKTLPDEIKSNEWNVINVMFKTYNGMMDNCGNIIGDQKMRIFIYVNGYLKLVSKELPAFKFHELNESFDKQEGVPFNISLGGGTQGLMESAWIDNYKEPFYWILPIEQNFAGSFIGDIRSFKFYDCQLQYNEIKNNYLYEIKK